MSSKTIMEGVVLICGLFFGQVLLSSAVSTANWNATERGLLKGEIATDSGSGYNTKSPPGTVSQKKIEDVAATRSPSSAPTGHRHKPPTAKCHPSSTSNTHRLNPPTTRDLSSNPTIHRQKPPTTRDLSSSSTIHRHNRPTAIRHSASTPTTQSAERRDRIPSIISVLLNLTFSESSIFAGRKVPKDAESLAPTEDPLAAGRRASLFRAEQSVLPLLIHALNGLTPKKTLVSARLVVNDTVTIDLTRSYSHRERSQTTRPQQQRLSTTRFPKLSLGQVSQLNSMKYATDRNTAQFLHYKTTPAIASSRFSISGAANHTSVKSNSFQNKNATASLQHTITPTSTRSFITATEELTKSNDINHATSDKRSSKESSQGKDIETKNTSSKPMSATTQPPTSFIATEKSSRYATTQTAALTASTVGLTNEGELNSMNTVTPERVESAADGVNSRALGPTPVPTGTTQWPVFSTRTNVSVYALSKTTTSALQQTRHKETVSYTTSPPSSPGSATMKDMNSVSQQQSRQRYGFSTNSVAMEVKSTREPTGYQQSSTNFYSATPSEFDSVMPTISVTETLAERAGGLTRGTRKIPNTEVYASSPIVTTGISQAVVTNAQPLRQSFATANPLFAPKSNDVIYSRSTVTEPATETPFQSISTSIDGHSLRMSAVSNKRVQTMPARTDALPTAPATSISAQRQRHSAQALTPDTQTGRTMSAHSLNTATSTAPTALHAAATRPFHVPNSPLFSQDPHDVSPGAISTTPTQKRSTLFNFAFPETTIAPTQTISAFPYLQGTTAEIVTQNSDQVTNTRKTTPLHTDTTPPRTASTYEFWTTQKRIAFPNFLPSNANNAGPGLFGMLAGPNSPSPGSSNKEPNPFNVNMYGNFTSNFDPFSSMTGSKTNSFMALGSKTRLMMPSHQQNKPENVGGFNPSSSLAASSEVSYPNPAFPWVSAAALKQQSFGALNGGPETRFQSQWHQQSMPAGSGSVYVAFPPWHFGGGGQGQTQNQALNSAFNFIRSGTTAGSVSARAADGWEETSSRQVSFFGRKRRKRRQMEDTSISGQSGSQDDDSNVFAPEASMYGQGIVTPFPLVPVDPDSSSFYAIPGNSQINKGLGGCCPVGGSVQVNTTDEQTGGYQSINGNHVANNGSMLNPYLNKNKMESYPQQNYGGGNPQQTYGGGNPQQNYGGGNPQQNYGGSKPQQNYGGGNPQQTYGGGNPQQNYGGGKPQQNYGGGNPQQNYGGANPQQNYGGGNPQQNYGGGNPQQTDFAEVEQSWGTNGLSMNGFYAFPGGGSGFESGFSPGSNLEGSVFGRINGEGQPSSASSDKTGRESALDWSGSGNGQSNRLHPQPTDHLNNAFAWTGQWVESRGGSKQEMGGGTDWDGTWKDSFPGVDEAGGRGVDGGVKNANSQADSDGTPLRQQGSSAGKGTMIPFTFTRYLKYVILGIVIAIHTFD